MEKPIEHLNLSFSELKNSKFVTFEDVKILKKVMGVYIIYSSEDEILYIGSTNNFHVRFGTDLRHESTHTLIRKMLKAEVHSTRAIAADFFKNHYKYKIWVCENKREAEALEHIAIWILDPSYNKNYIPLTV